VVTIPVCPLILLGYETYLDGHFSPADRIKLVSVGFESYIEIMKKFPPGMQSELRAVGLYLYGGGFPALAELDKETLIFGTARAPQERDVDGGHCGPNAAGPQIAVGGAQRV
jgi:hypothetical protein